MGLISVTCQLKITGFLALACIFIFYSFYNYAYSVQFSASLFLISTKFEIH